jgi:chlorophyllase
MEPAASSTADLYVGHGNPYEVSDLAVRTIDIKRCDRDAPAALRIHAPEMPGDYAVVLFQHGFMTRNSAYDDVLRHLSSQGFVVVAPQMYEPGIGPLLGNPTAAVEAELAEQIVAWLPGNLDRITGVRARTDRLGISGHSRGGKVAWAVSLTDPARIRAIVGVDPVDGAGGPLGNQSRVVQGRFEFDLPALVIGTELGGDCAPAGDNHVQFYEASPPPAWHIVALGQGHGDMLDEAEAAAAAMFCPSGSDRAGMQRLTAGLLVSFFRAALQGDEAAYGVLVSGPECPDRDHYGIQVAAPWATRIVPRSGCGPELECVCDARMWSDGSGSE